MFSMAYIVYPVDTMKAKEKGTQSHTSLRSTAKHANKKEHRYSLKIILRCFFVIL